MKRTTHTSKRVFRSRKAKSAKAIVRRYKSSSKDRINVVQRLIASLSKDEIDRVYNWLNLRTRYSGHHGEMRPGMIQAIPLANTLRKWDLIPQAVIARPLEEFIRHVSTRISSGYDALDEYSGVAFAMDGTPFAVMHYKGHPPDTATIYLPRDFSTVPEITNFVSEIMAKFNLPKESVLWQRKDNPEL
jgi:hypothetical protein